MFADGKLVGTSACAPYVAKTEYTRNTIGCKVPRGPSPEAQLNFCGELGAVHFVRVGTMGEMGKVHAVLANVFDVIGTSELVAVLGSESGIACNPRLAARVTREQVADSGIMERLFLVANPKWAFSDSSEAVVWISSKPGKPPIELRNHVDRVYQSTRVQHNTPGQTVLANIGGVKTLLPLLHRVIFNERSDARFVYPGHVHRVGTPWLRCSSSSRSPASCASLSAPVPSSKTRTG